jgi:muramoyltetrapeptide carboxypeptidase
MNIELKPGDKIAIVAPSSTWPHEEDIKKAQSWLKESYQLEAVYGEEVYTNSSAEVRANALLDYIKNPEIKAIWALQGGEGAADVVPFLEQHKSEIKKASPKLLMGFSDFTVMLSYFDKAYTWPVIHVFGLLQVAKEKILQKEIDRLMDFLISQEGELRLDNLEPLNTLATKEKTIKARIIGGTLSILNISIRDVWEPDIENKIVIIEDINEKPHAVSRTLKYLNRIGFFDEAAAVIFGDFCTVPFTKDAKLQSELEAGVHKALRLFAEQVNCPVLLTKAFGHGKLNYPFSFSSETTLTLGDTPLLVQRR